MKKLFLFLLLFSFGFSQVRSINGSLVNSQRFVWDTTGTPNIFKITTATTGVHTIWFPYQRFALTSGGGSVGNADSLGSLPASSYFRKSDTVNFKGGLLKNADSTTLKFTLASKDSSVSSITTSPTSFISIAGNGGQAKKITFDTSKTINANADGVSSGTKYWTGQNTFVDSLYLGTASSRYGTLKFHDGGSVYNASIKVNPSVGLSSNTLLYIPNQSGIFILNGDTAISRLYTTALLNAKLNTADSAIVTASDGILKTQSGHTAILKGDTTFLVTRYDTTGWAPKGSYQVSGTYLVPSDSTANRTFSDLKYLKNADSTSQRTFSNLKYWSKADLDTANRWSPKGTYIFPSDTAISTAYTTARLSYKLNTVDSTIGDVGYGLLKTQSGHTFAPYLDTSVAINKAGTQELTGVKSFHDRQQFDSTLTKGLTKGTGAVWYDGTTGATPTSGAGTRMMWSPIRRAFRAGGVSGTQWNDDSIGTYSMAFGLDVKALGSNSFSAGQYNTSRGGLSYSFGSGNLNNSINGSLNIGLNDTILSANAANSEMNYQIGNNNKIGNYTFGARGYGNWQFGQYLYTESRGTWTLGSDNTNTKKLIPFSDRIILYNEPVINWNSDGLTVGSTRLSTAYQSVSPIDSIRYGQYYTLRALGGYASFDIGSERTFSVNATSGNLDSYLSHTYLSFNYDSLQGIVFNPTKTDAQAYGNVQIANGGLTMGGATLDSAFTTSSTQGVHIGRGLLVGGNASVGGTLTTTGAINGQTISSSAVLTGTLSVGAVTSSGTYLQTSVSDNAGFRLTRSGTTPTDFVFQTDATFGAGISLYSFIASAYRLSIDGSGVTSFTNNETRTSAGTGDLIISNTKSLRGVNAAGNDTYSLISLNASNEVSFARNAIFAGTINSGAVTSSGKSQFDSTVVVGKVYNTGIPSDSTGLATGALYFNPTTGQIYRKF